MTTFRDIPANDIPSYIGHWFDCDDTTTVEPMVFLGVENGNAYFVNPSLRRSPSSSNPSWSMDHGHLLTLNEDLDPAWPSDGVPA